LLKSGGRSRAGGGDDVTPQGGGGGREGGGPGENNTSKRQALEKRETRSSKAQESHNVPWGGSKVFYNQKKTGGATM